MAPRRGSASLRRALGVRIRKVREEAGRTQESVAWAIDVSNALLSRIESGENLPSVPVLFALAKELGVAVVDLVAFDMRDPRARLLDAIRRGDNETFAAVTKSLGF